MDANFFIYWLRKSGVVALSNGCLCCSLSENLQSTVWKLLQGDYSEFAEKEFDEIDYLVIETSGITDPIALIELLERKYGKMTRARLDSVVTVIDGDAVYADLQKSNIESGLIVDQLTCADVVIVNKVDLIAEDQLVFY